MERTSLTDEQLLESFFADARTAMPDDGFANRVMTAIETLEAQQATATAVPLTSQAASASPAAEHSLSTAQRALQLLNVVAAIVAALLLLRAGYDLCVFISNIQLSDILVNVMLGLHRLRDIFASPNFSLLGTTAIVLIVLMTLTIQLCSTLIHNAED